MRKTNKLMSFILVLAMLVSLVPSAVFAAGEPVARIGDTEYDNIDDALGALENGGTLELLANVTSKRGQFGKKDSIIKMNGYCITSDIFSFFNGKSRTFENGTAVGTFQIANRNSPSIALTAPTNAEFALKGGIDFSGSGGSITISGAKVGLIGTLSTNTTFDISGTDKAVELTAEPNIINYTVLGSTDPKTVPTSEAVYDPDKKTYTVNGETAKRIKSKKMTEPDAPILTKDGAPISDTYELYAGQSITFDITYTSSIELSTYIQKGAQNSDISATIANDKKSVTITTKKDSQPNTTYNVSVFPKGYQSKKSTSVYINVLAPCDHRNDDGTYSLNENYVCTTCNSPMIASVEKAGATDYYDVFQDAVDSTPTGGKASDCTLTLLRSNEFDDFFSIKGKGFTFKVLNGAVISFAKSYGYTNINADTNGNPSDVAIDGDISFGEVRLGGGSSLKTSENTTIEWLSLSNIDVKIDIRGKMEKLSVDTSDDNVTRPGDFLDENTAFYNYQTNTWLSSGESKEYYLYNVTMKTKPFKDFAVSSYSSSLYYPGSNIVLFKCKMLDSASFDPAKARITVSKLPAGGRVENNRTFKNGDEYYQECGIENFPAGEYSIPFTLEYEGYTETQDLTFTVLPCPVEKSSNITVKINGKTDNLFFDYIRGGQTLDVQVLDRGEDVTDSFTIKGNTITSIGEYDITITAKDNTNYSGTITKQVEITPIAPTQDVDYTVVKPTNFKYDGNPKEYKIDEINNSGITSEAEEVTLAYRKDGFSIPSAPTDPGNYAVAINVKEPIGNFRGSYFGDLDTFTIEKADSEFEFTDLKTSYGFEESAKIKGKIKKAGENAAFPTGKIEINEIGGSVYVPIGTATLDENGEFEFNLNDLIAKLLTPTGTFKFEIKYSGDDYYSAKTETENITITKTPITLDVSNTEHRYAPATERKITVTSQGSSKLTVDSLVVRYYLVDENSGKLTSVKPVEKTISAGRYLYVISFKDYETAEKYELNGAMLGVGFDGALADTTVPNISDYANIGFMDIKAASEISQKPISFKKGSVTLKQSSDFAEVNTLVNDNNSTVTYESSDTSVAEVDADGKVKAVKSGTATITAISTMEGATPVYASYTVNVKKELTKDSFDIKAVTKTYDGSKDATVTATLTDKSDESDIVNVSITAVFDSADAGENKDVTYEITGISGRNADKYVLSDVSANLKGTVKGTIEKAPVSVICAKVTTRTFDGTAQTADVSAMANGRTFDGFTVKYNGSDNAAAVGEYTITIVLNGDTENNYTVLPFDAVLKIVNASQDVFSIENIPENVYYGDEFTVAALGANGDVTYKITSGDDVASVDKNSGEVRINDVGTVTITATSTKDGYSNKTAVRTFAAKPRILTPVVKSVSGRTYDGTLTVDAVLTLNNTVNGGENEINTAGTMLTPDAGNGKIVYISLSNTDLDDSEHYTLSTNTLQATVNIEPITITNFAISAFDKKYDGTKNAQVNIESISDVLPADNGLVSIVGNAEFDDENADENEKNVTFTALSLTGAKAANYTLGKTFATDKAYIKPLEVKFTIGQTSFVYDGTDKEINVSATDENGRIFTDFDVVYDETPSIAKDYTATIVLRDATNYYTNQGSVNVKITEATQDQLVIAGLPGTIEYGSEFALSAFGGTDGGDVSWNVTSGNAEISKDADGNGKVKITGIGKIEIEAVKTSDNYKDVSAKVIFSAMPKNITFELSNLEQTYGEVSGITVAPSDSDITDFEVTYDNSSDIPENAGRYTVKVKTKDENENYKGSASATFVINKAAISGGSISGINDSYTYGSVISGADVSGIPSGASAKITYAGTGIYIPREEAPTKAGNYTAIATITGENYETLTITKEFAIKKAPLTVKAENKSRAYGEANPIFTLSYDGFINGETKDVLLYEPTAVTSANASSAVGEYDINVSGGYAENYEFTYQPGTLTITGAQSASLYITNLPGTVYVNDRFMLGAFYGNTKINAVWESSNPEIADVDANGNVTVKKSGTVTITATADSNYNNASASVKFTVKQSSITLVPKDLVKVYNGQRQEISFEDVPGFTPIFSGEGKNVDVKYTLITDPTVTEPINAGTYSVTYTVNDGGFIGGGTTTMYINKATAEVKPKNITKVYGSKAEFELETSSALVSQAELENIAKSASFASDGAPESAPVKDGGYDITAVLGESANNNINFVVNGTGNLAVTKAPLTVKVKDVSREYGAENPVLEVVYDGFVNGEAEDVLTGELALSYDENINTETAVGTHTGVTTASGLISDNYEITFESGNVEVTKIKVTATGGTSRSGYLTVNLNKSIADLTKTDFEVKNGESNVELTSVTASSDNKTYTLNGSFTVGTAYTVNIKLGNNATHEIENLPLTITPSRSSSGGSGSGGGSSVSSYTVKFETNGGSAVASQSVSKNSTVKEPTAPTKDGFEFAGWYSDKDLKTKYDFSDKVTKSITLYAKWSEKQTPPTDPSETKWENPFTDVREEDWFYNNVKFAVQNMLFSGTSKTTFEPNTPITRGMFVTVLYRAEGEPAVNKSIPFADVKADSYYANAVIWAQQNGIVSGVSENEFAPDTNITREQIATIMFRYAKKKGYDVSVGENTNILSYTDAEDISEYATEAMQYAVGNGLINGKTETTLNPKAAATRAEIAAILQRFIEANKKK